MLALIIHKELRDSLLNVRFVAACIISMVLIVSSIAILTSSYADDLQDYHNRVSEQDERLYEKAYNDIYYIHASDAYSRYRRDVRIYVANRR